MSESRKMAAFLRSAIREAEVLNSDHPFVEAAKRFTVDVDVLGYSTVDGWFESNKEDADLIKQVYEAYYKEEEPVEPSPSTKEADQVTESLKAMQKRLKVLEENAKPEETAEEEKTEDDKPDQEPESSNEPEAEEAPAEEE